MVGCSHRRRLSPRSLRRPRQSGSGWARWSDRPPGHHLQEAKYIPPTARTTKTNAATAQPIPRPNLVSDGREPTSTIPGSTMGLAISSTLIGPKLFLQLSVIRELSLQAHHGTSPIVSLRDAIPLSKWFCTAVLEIPITSATSVSVHWKQCTNTTEVRCRRESRQCLGKGRFDVGSAVERNLAEHHWPGSPAATAQFGPSPQVTHRVLHALKAPPMLPPIRQDFLSDFPAGLPHHMSL